MTSLYPGKRLAKNILTETTATIQNYNAVLDALMQQFRDLAVRDTLINVHRMGKSWSQIHSETSTNLWSSRRFELQGHGTRGRCRVGYLQVLSPRHQGEHSVRDQGLDLQDWRGRTADLLVVWDRGERQIGHRPYNSQVVR